MKKINTEEVSKQYNIVRGQNAGKKFHFEQVINLLKEAGISGSMAAKIVANSTLLNKFNIEGKGRGKHVGYTFPYTPVHQSFFANWIYPPKEVKKKFDSFEDECADYLKKQGYQLKRCVGFDEESFKKDYPQLWEKYLIYENV